MSINVLSSARFNTPQQQRTNASHQREGANFNQEQLKNLQEVTRQLQNQEATNRFVEPLLEAFYILGKSDDGWRGWIAPHIIDGKTIRIVLSKKRDVNYVRLFQERLGADLFHGMGNADFPEYGDSTFCKYLLNINLEHPPSFIMNRVTAALKALTHYESLPKEVSSS